MSQQINLYNPDLRRQRDLLTLTNVALSVAAFATILLVIGGVFRWQAQEKSAEVAALDVQIAAATVRLASLSAEPGAEAAKKAVELLQQQAAERREVVALLRSGFVGARSEGGGFSDYLRGLARQTVNGLWLTGFSVTQGGAGMEIRGHMTEAAALPDYIQRLNAESRFHGSQFVSLNVATPTMAAGTPGPALRAGINSFVLTAVAPSDPSKEKAVVR